MEIIEAEQKRKVSKVRGESQKAIRKGNSKAGTKRLKVTEKASSRIESTDDQSQYQLASETYRKIKEVEYRKETIYDKNGMEVAYDHDPETYKQARKRIQNRESAIRSRYRKRQYFTELEVRVEDLEEENKRLGTQNATLIAEKRLLSEQLDYFKLLVGNMQPGFSHKSTDGRSRETLSREGSISDDHKDILLEPRYDMVEGELPHLGNYKRPLGSRIKSAEQDDEILVLSRNNENSVASTAGLFFVAVLM